MYPEPGWSARNKYGCVGSGKASWKADARGTTFPSFMLLGSRKSLLSQRRTREFRAGDQMLSSSSPKWIEMPGAPSDCFFHLFANSYPKLGASLCPQNDGENRMERLEYSRLILDMGFNIDLRLFNPNPNLDLKLQIQLDPSSKSQSQLSSQLSH